MSRKGAPTSATAKLESACIMAAPLPLFRKVPVRGKESSTTTSDALITARLISKCKADRAFIPPGVLETANRLAEEACVGR